MEPNQLITRGIDQREIIREFSYEEMLFLVVLGRRPLNVERDILRAVLVSHVSHGITGQSTLAVMQAADCRSDFLHAAVAGFSVGAGIYHQGGLRATMEELARMTAMPEDTLTTHVVARLRDHQRIMGFGHRFHDADPRAQALLALARERGFDGPSLRALRHLAEMLERLKGVSVNIEGAGGALLLDLGFPPSIAHLFILAGRSPMYAAAYLERIQRAPRPFSKIEICDLVEEDEAE